MVFFDIPRTKPVAKTLRFDGQLPPAYRGGPKMPIPAFLAIASALP